jgi:hypothetical protein
LCWESKYPTLDATHVLATTFLSADNVSWMTCDPSTSLTGMSWHQSWASSVGATTDQKFNIDLGSGYIIKRIYYENTHETGGATNCGAKTVLFYGTNSSVAFNNITYVDTTDLNLLWSGNFYEHVALDVADPRYINIISNNVPYRYYVFRIADNYGSANLVSIRRIELQIECE